MFFITFYACSTVADILHHTQADSLFFTTSNFGQITIPSILSIGPLKVSHRENSCVDLYTVLCTRIQLKLFAPTLDLAYPPGIFNLRIFHHKASHLTTRVREELL